MKRKFFVSLGVGVSFLLIAGLTLAQSPPFSTVTISGTARTGYTKVGLFKGGSARKPFKTADISPDDRTYTLEVNIPEDMKKYQTYYYTDMRFWGDRNGDNIRDSNEPYSACHFIIWKPTTGKVYLKIYKGARYDIDAPDFTYNIK